jgi:hypothetical protein
MAIEEDNPPKALWRRYFAEGLASEAEERKAALRALVKELRIGPSAEQICSPHPDVNIAAIEAILLYLLRKEAGHS